MNRQRTSAAYRDLASEAEFESAVIDLAVLLGWECFHVHDARRFWPGWPDWIAFQPGRHIWFELKRAGRQLEPAQLRWQERIREGGGECYLWRPDDWPEIERVLRGEGG